VARASNATIKPAATHEHNAPGRHDDGFSGHARVELPQPPHSDTARQNRPAAIADVRHDREFDVSCR